MLIMHKDASSTLCTSPSEINQSICNLAVCSYQAKSNVALLGSEYFNEAFIPSESENESEK